MTSQFLKTAMAALARPRYSAGRYYAQQFQGLRHTLGNLVEYVEEVSQKNASDPSWGQYKDSIKKLLENLILECAPKAPLLLDVMFTLKEASKYIEGDRIDLVRATLLGIQNELDALEESPRQSIYRLCADHSLPDGDVQFFLQEWDLIDHRGPYSPPVLFDLGELRMAVAALRANAYRANRMKLCCLRYEEFLEGATRQAVITWLEHSDWLSNCKTKQEGLDKIRWFITKSAREKGIHRGLPQVVLFGIENGATRAEVLIPTGWVPLWKQGKSITFPKDVLPESYGFHEPPNYGWRFLFRYDEAATEEAKTTQPLTQTKARGGEAPSTDRIVVLVDDEKNAGWLKPIRDYLINNGYDRNQVSILNPQGSTVEDVILHWTTQVRELSKSKKNACSVITDSWFTKGDDTDERGGEKLLLELSKEELLFRGLVYSSAPNLEAEKFTNPYRSRIASLSKNSNNYEGDAAHILHFLLTGGLNPLGELIQMIQRLQSSVKALLESNLDPPWILIKRSNQNYEDWREQLDPWGALTKGLGEGAMSPFAPWTWRFFTNTPFKDVVTKRLSEKGALDTEIFVESVRCILSPIDSLICATESASKYGPWQGPNSPGALRTLWDIVVNGKRLFSDDKSFRIWSKETEKKINHRDVALKYRHFLNLYRERIILKVTEHNWEQICVGARAQVSNIDKFMKKWGDE